MCCFSESPSFVKDKEDRSHQPILPVNVIIRLHYYTRFKYAFWKACSLYFHHISLKEKQLILIIHWKSVSISVRVWTELVILISQIIVTFPWPTKINTHIIHTHSQTHLALFSCFHSFLEKIIGGSFFFSLVMIVKICKLKTEIVFTFFPVEKYVKGN